MPHRERIRWTPPVSLSTEEERICSRCKRNGRLYAFLRRHRAELFDESFQGDLAELYVDRPEGRPPVPPALLAMVTVLQAADGVSDEGAVNEAIFDSRWQMVLGCLGSDEAPFSQGVLVDFRRRLIAHGLHFRLIERSVELAQSTGGFGYKQLRVALDSAPLWGAGRVEDTFNLIGHALHVVARCAAAIVERPIATVLKEAGATLLGHSSLKAALDIDWDDKEEQHRALQALLHEVERIRCWIDQTLDDAQRVQAPLAEALAALERVIAQDLEPDPNGGDETGARRITRGTAKDRQISIADPSMRHGRKSRSTTIKGFKRYIAKELDHGLILGVHVMPANQPEREATSPLREQVESHGDVTALYIDRGFLASDWARETFDQGNKLVCRPWRARNGKMYSKSEFDIDLAKGRVRCPAGQSQAIRGHVVRFPAQACDPCDERAACTRAREGRGRTISIHPQETMFQALGTAKATPKGRAELRERVPVEHSLAHICNRQGRRARYVGTDKNIFDLCRYAFIENCFAADRFERAAA